MRSPIPEPSVTLCTKHTPWIYTSMALTSWRWNLTSLLWKSCQVEQLTPSTSSYVVFCCGQVFVFIKSILLFPVPVPWAVVLPNFLCPLQPKNTPVPVIFQLSSTEDIHHKTSILTGSCTKAGASDAQLNNNRCKCTHSPSHQLTIFPWQVLHCMPCNISKISLSIIVLK